jgi:hypothetical protein
VLGCLADRTVRRYTTDSGFGFGEGWVTAMQRAGEICAGAKDGAEAGEACGKTETSMRAPRAGLDVGTTEARFTSSAPDGALLLALFGDRDRSIATAGRHVDIVRLHDQPRGRVLLLLRHNFTKFGIVVGRL